MTERSVRAREEALRLMGEHGLQGWFFAFNTNLRRAGVCFFPHNSKPGRIELSVHYIERNTEEDVRDTILHEIAHALVGHGHGHDDVWKAKCVEVGAKPERCYDAKAIDMPPGRWRATCPGCRKVHNRHRRPRVLVGWYCKPCGRENGQLRWVEVDR